MRRHSPLGATLRSGSSLALMLVALLLITFLISSAAPIDPVLKVVGDRATPEAYAKAKAELGLDKPLHQQFLAFAQKALVGDLGSSTSTGRESG